MAKAKSVPATKTKLIHERVPIESLVLDPENARKHPVMNLESIKASLQEFGQQRDILVSRIGRIVVAGNGTMMAAKELGWTEIDVRWTDLTGDEAMAYALADNGTALLAEWDMPRLEMQTMKLKSIGIDMAMFGFADLMPKPVNENFDESKEDEIPDEAPRRVQSNEVWQLGQHRLICGDSTSPANIERLMQGEKCDMVFTDPPYRMEAEGGSNHPIGQSARKLGEKIKHLCDFDPVAFLEVLPSIFEKGKMNAFIFCNKDLVPDYLVWGRDEGFAFNILVWKKPTALPLGGTHRPDIEYLLHLRKSAVWNAGVDGVNYSKCLEFGRENSTGHPTMKPVGLISNELLISSNAGGLVVDFFLGSGSTIIAAEKTGRRCYGFEIDPKYADIAIQRWENVTGGKAERISKPSVAL